MSIEANKATVKRAAEMFSAERLGERWSQMDQVALLQQIGAMPAP